MGMSVRVTRASGEPLTRSRVVETALRLVDEHGLAALSMHRLGAELGVRGMSLYGHVEGKDDLLDEIVERIWSEITPPTGDGDWREAVRSLARALREVALRHPSAAPLLLSRRRLPGPALRVSDGFLRTLQTGGIAESTAVPLLRTVVAYGLGYALAELSWPGAAPDADEDELRRFRRVSSLVPRNLDDDMLRVALLVCGDCDTAYDFELGLELMVRGLEAHLSAADGRCG
jgi:AcrR family transcriptional regulator